MGWSGGELGATIERVRIGTTVSLYHGAYIREGGNAASAFECRPKTRGPTKTSVPTKPGIQQHPPHALLLWPVAGMFQVESWRP
jgi:hypothetical protein